MKLRQLWILLSGVALLVTGFLLGASAPAGASGASGCVGDAVVALDVELRSRPGHDTFGFTLSEPLPPGEWAVATASFDRYPGRSESVQPHEQWLLDITDHVVLGPTTDLPDGTESAAVTDALGTFSSVDGVSHFTVRHAAPSTPDGTNSVTAHCVAFTLVAPPPTTVPPTTVPPTTVPPTTVPPTTVPPTTVPPTTVPPTTVPPTTVPRPLPALLSAAATVDCATGQVYVLLGNEGDLGATVDVALPLSAIETGLEVAGGATTTSSLPIGGLQGSSEVRVTDSVTGETYLRAAIEIDCDDPARPTATAVLDCAAGVVVVVLGNQSGDPAMLTVLHERVASIAQVEVAAGESAEVEVSLDNADVIPIRVIDAHGTDVLRVRVDNVCASPGPVDPPAGPPFDSPSDDGAVGSGDCAVSTHAAPRCADVRIVVQPACPAAAEIVIQRAGIGRERFVVLVDGTVAGVVAIDGSGEATLPVAVGSVDAELTVSRSTASEPITIGTLRCDAESGRAGPVAAALVVVAVLASAAGVTPWPVRPGPV